jgi:GAF domain-containing protein
MTVQAIADASAATPFDPLRLCRAVDEHALPLLRHSLCTVNRLDAQSLHLTRFYSSNPLAYPPGGSKDKRGTDWGRKVLVERALFVGEGMAAIRQSFDDHAAIERLGLQSVINVPIVFEQRCLGTLNLLMTAPAVQPEQVELVRLLGVLLLPVFLKASP